MSILTINKSQTAIGLSFSKDRMSVLLEDGRELSVPLEWFPSLRDAPSTQLKNWRFIGDGEGIHWEDLDEDISVECLIS